MNNCLDCKLQIIIIKKLKDKVKTLEKRLTRAIETIERKSK